MVRKAHVAFELNLYFVDKQHKFYKKNQHFDIYSANKNVSKQLPTISYGPSVLQEHQNANHEGLPKLYYYCAQAQ